MSEYDLVTEYNKVFADRARRKEEQRMAAQKAAEWKAKVIQEGRCAHRATLAKDKKVEVQNLIALTGGINTAFLFKGMHVDEMGVDFYGPENKLQASWGWMESWRVEAWDDKYIHLSRIEITNKQINIIRRSEEHCKFVLQHWVEEVDMDDEDWGYEDAVHTVLEYYRL